MTPFWFQEPPTAKAGKLHTVCGGAPVTSTFFSCPKASNATYRLSGDQNIGGTRPPSANSVPGSGRASLSSRLRTQRRTTPSAPEPAKTRRRPSGEMANAEPSLSLTPVDTSTLTGSRATGWRVGYNSTKITKALHAPAANHNAAVRLKNLEAPFPPLTVFAARGSPRSSASPEWSRFSDSSGPRSTAFSCSRSPPFAPVGEPRTAPAPLAGLTSATNR